MWDCDLDSHPGGYHSSCQPQFAYARLDSADSRVSTGYNFREARYNGTAQRDLWKRAGLLLVVNVTGMARRFSWAQLMWRICEAIAVLGVARFICDWVLSGMIEAVWCGPVVGYVDQSEIALKRHQGDLPRMGLKTEDGDGELQRVASGIDTDSDDEEFVRTSSRPALYAEMS